jgi:aminotransferase EvaB
LELALRAVGVGPGKRVATVANAGGYGTVAILAAGGVPVYLDIDPETLTVSEVALREAIAGRHVDAVIVTHLYGLLVDLRQLAHIARGCGVAMIEDCAQAHGAAIAGARAGSLGDVGCFSYYPTKNLGALGDGGAVVTSNLAIAERIRQLRQYGWTEKYRCAFPGGRNSRLDEMQASILRVKLPRLDGWNARRRAVAEAYRLGIVNPELRCPGPAGEEHVAHLYVVRSHRRDELRSHLRQRGIATDVHYPVPDYRHAAFQGVVPAASCPITELACNQVLTLPCFPEMTDVEVKEVIDCVNDW